MTDQATSLEDFLDTEYDLPERPEDREGFAVVDASQADWCLRKYARAMERRDAAKAEADRQFEMIRTWLEGELARADADLDFFSSVLAGYHRRLLAEDPKAKTVRLPHGTLTSRKRQPDWAIDPDEFLPWAKEHRPELVRTKEEVDRTTVKRRLLPMTDETGTGNAVDPESGEVVPGITIVAHGDPSFSVEVTR